jgi:hypothetical protein
MRGYTNFPEARGQQKKEPPALSPHLPAAARYAMLFHVFDE